MEIIIIILSIIAFLILVELALIQKGIKHLVINKILEMRKQGYYNNKNYKEKLLKKK